MKDYPLYPELSEKGQEEAQKLVDRFKAEITKAADAAIADLYCDVVVHIESASWTNFRNDLMDGFKNYDNRLVHGEYDFKEIRQSILKNHRNDIIADLNQDMLEEIKSLKNQLKISRERY
jgi:hypothetical protein